MNYCYYPGCSQERNASAYHQSTMAVAKKLGVGFTEVGDWNCCGATEYADHKADAIVTLCPMCQLNLDGYQDSVNKRFGTNYQMPILYFTQLMGLAFGVPAADLGFGKELVPADLALKKIGVEPPPPAPAGKRQRPPKEALPMPAAELPERARKEATP